ncbi:cupin domain-containing protein [Xylanimonas ulmi]|uniref:Ethanolamine utilization protein EutQ n=1 Tax=Xylanimonas ulmi TaxID=228973 RepID=A0A4Q7M024_9MICO|nr:cupin domain-containing protein [Xylanibacterium ulmi]RZS60057.1 ethanolamine utilization protein EutQ [Xylanibacterium ulmi]
MGRIAVSAADVRAAGEGGRLVLPARAVVTPLAREVARDLRVTLVDDTPAAGQTSPQAPATPVHTPVQPTPGPGPSSTAGPGAPTPGLAGQCADGVEARVRAIVASVLGAVAPTSAPPPAPTPARPVVLARACDAPLAPFGHPGPEPGQDVRTVDVVTSAHGAPMAAGYMTLTKGSFPWTLTYDEVQVVLEGELRIGTSDGERVGRPGDVLYVPKGSRITFGTPGWAKFVYVTFPADWEGQAG